MGTLTEIQIQERPRVVQSVAIPCYDESASIDELHVRVTEACRSQVGQSYEIGPVNGGSTDAIRERRHVLIIDADLQNPPERASCALWRPAGVAAAGTLVLL